MKLAVIIEYGGDKDVSSRDHPAHRTHLRTFLETVSFKQPGPLRTMPEHRWFSTPTARKQWKILKQDPLVAAGVTTN